MMKKCLYIAAFGFFGAILRYFIKNIPVYHYKEVIPLNTIIINVTGSFALALVSTLALEVFQIREEIRLGITTGFLGAYTTFSTMCKDTVNLIYSGFYFSALSYVTISVVLGLCSAFFGVIVAREYISKFIAKDEEDYDEEIK